MSDTVNAPRAAPSRVWFLGHGCKQVPLERCRTKVRWGHPDGYFLRPDGQKAIHNRSQGYERNCHNHPAPILREAAQYCHILMALAFYGERPTFTDKNGKPYVGICHHLIPDLLNYKPANLLCWLTREQHSEADRRQRALKTVVPDGNLYLFSYERLRELQDPRTMTREEFELELEAIRKHGYHTAPSDPCPTT